MKLLALICMPAWLATVLALLAVGDSQEAQASKPGSPRYTAFVSHATWPTAKTIQQLRYRGNVAPEVAELQRTLDQKLRREYAPSGAYLKHNVIALREFQNGDDYLLLQYTASGTRIEVQDGKALYIRVTPGDRGLGRSADIGAFVSRLAGKVLNIPEEKGKERVPKVFVSNLDLGKAKVGNLLYGDPHQLQNGDWYSLIRWWSDGKGVLFEISKADWRTLSRLAAPPPGTFAPRRFRSKMKR